MANKFIRLALLLTLLLHGQSIQSVVKTIKTMGPNENKAIILVGTEHMNPGSNYFDEAIKDWHGDAEKNVSDFKESLKKDIASWYPNAHIDQIEKIAKKIIENDQMKEIFKNYLEKQQNKIDEAFNTIYKPKVFSDCQQDILEHSPKDLLKNNTTKINLFYEDLARQSLYKDYFKADYMLKKNNYETTDYLIFDDELLTDLDLKYIAQTDGMLDEKFNFIPSDPRRHDYRLFETFASIYWAFSTENQSVAKTNPKLKERYIQYLKEFDITDEEITPDVLESFFIKRIKNTIYDLQDEVEELETGLNNEEKITQLKKQIDELEDLYCSCKEAGKIFTKDRESRLKKQFIRNNLLITNTTQSFFEAILKMNELCKKISTHSSNKEELLTAIAQLPEKIQEWFTNPEKTLESLTSKEKKSYPLSFMPSYIKKTANEYSLNICDLFTMIKKALYDLECCYADAQFYENIMKDQKDNPLTILICGDAHRDAVQNELREIGYNVISEKTTDFEQEVTDLIGNENLELMYEEINNLLPQLVEQVLKDLNYNFCECEDCIPLAVEHDMAYELTDKYRTVLPKFDRTEKNEDDDTHCNNSTEEIVKSTCELN